MESTDKQQDGVPEPSDQTECPALTTSQRVFLLLQRAHRERLAPVVAKQEEDWLSTTHERG